jgi:hypothetical protein
VPPPDQLTIQTLDPPTLEKLVAKVVYAAGQPGAADQVSRWRTEHGGDHATERAQSFAVVGSTLMFLHPCSDGVVVPVAEDPDGRVIVYTDPEHAGESFYRNSQ